MVIVSKLIYILNGVLYFKHCICTGVQKWRQSGATQTQRLDRFLPTAESWHAKMRLMMVGLNLNSNSFSIDYGRFEGQGRLSSLNSIYNQSIYTCMWSPY